MGPTPTNPAGHSLVDLLNPADGKWALAIARLLETWQPVPAGGSWRVAFDHLRVALDLPPGVYERWPDFERHVLQDARKAFAGRGIALSWQVDPTADPRRAAVTLSWTVDPSDRTASAAEDGPAARSSGESVPDAVHRDDGAPASSVADGRQGNDGAGNSGPGDGEPADGRADGDTVADVGSTAHSEANSGGTDLVMSNQDQEPAQPSGGSVAVSRALQPMSSLGEVQTQVAHLEGQLLLAQQEVALVRTQRDQASRELAKSDTVYRTQIQLLQSQVTQFQGEAVQLRERLAETQHRLEALRTQSEEVLSIERRNALARVTDVQHALDEARGRMAELEGDLDQEREHVRAAFAEIEDQLQGDRKRHVGEMARLTEEMTGLTVELEQARRLVGLHSAEVEDLREQIDQERAESAALLAEERATYSRLLDEEKTAAKSMTDMVRAEAAKAVASAESALAAALARNEALERKLHEGDSATEARLRGAKAAAELDQRRLMAEVSRLRTDLDFHKRRVAALSTGLAPDGEGNSAESERALAEANERIATLTNRLAGAQSELDNAAAREAQLTTEMQDLRREVQDLARQVAMARTSPVVKPSVIETRPAFSAVIDLTPVEAPAAAATASVAPVATATTAAADDIVPDVGSGAGDADPHPAAAVTSAGGVEATPVSPSPDTASAAPATADAAKSEPAPADAATTGEAKPVADKSGTAKPAPAKPGKAGADTSSDARLSALSQNFFTLTGRLRP